MDGPIPRGLTAQIHGLSLCPQAGPPIQMEVLRDGKPLTISVTPVNAPPQVDNLSDLIKPERDLIASLGVFVMDLKHSEVGAMLNLRTDTGVLVIGLLGGEPAIAADLSVGDAIRAVNGTPLKSRSSCARFSAGSNPAMRWCWK